MSRGSLGLRAGAAPSGFLGRLLRGLSRRPRHVLIDKSPVHVEREFVTLQDAHLTFHPYTGAYFELTKQPPLTASP